MDTPYQWTKQVASHWGGTRNGMIVHWPSGIQSRNELRTQFSHVIDVAPTVLEAADLPHPAFVHGIQQAPLEGVSMGYSFDDAAAAERHSTQYFEIFVNRGIYHQGWTAVTRHSTPWGSQADLPGIEDDVWELYSPDDWTQAHDLAAEQPEQLRRLQQLFVLEASRYGVFPLDDRRYERFNSDLAGRPQLVTGNTQLLFGGMGRLSENSVINIKNKSHAVTAQLEVEPEAAGVIIAQGGRFGGWVLYVHEGRPAYCYNLLGVQQFRVYGDTPLPPGDHQVRMEFAYDGGGLGLGGDVALFLDGEAIGTGRVAATQPMIFSADETTDLGGDSATPVCDDYDTRTSTFAGRVRWVQIDLGDDAEDADHLISPEERYRIAVALQ
jgi:Sulfatase